MKFTFIFTGLDFLQSYWILDNVHHGVRLVANARWDILSLENRNTKVEAGLICKPLFWPKFKIVLIQKVGRKSYYSPSFLVTWVSHRNFFLTSVFSQDFWKFSMHWFRIFVRNVTTAKYMNGSSSFYKGPWTCKVIKFPFIQTRVSNGTGFSCPAGHGDRHHWTVPGQRDTRTDIPELSRDKGTQGQPQNLAKGWDRPGCFPLNLPKPLEPLVIVATIFLNLIEWGVEYGCTWFNFKISESSMTI